MPQWVTADAYAQPWRIDDSTPPAARVQELDQLAAVAAQTPEIRAAARLVREHPNGPGWQGIARRALELAQSRPYRDDPPGEEWWQGPVWTLVHGGDCEDLATLLVSILTACGVPARDVWITLHGYGYNHVSVLAGPPGAELWAESILPGARLGEAPLEAAARLGGVQRLRGLAGPRIAPSGALSEPWQLLSSDGSGNSQQAWTQWAKPHTAEAWAAKASELTAASLEQQLDAAPWDRQHQAVMDAWSALSEVFLALDLPPAASPAYWVQLEGAYGPHAAPNPLAMLHPERATLKAGADLTSDTPEYDRVPVPAWLVDQTRQLYEAVQPDRPTGWVIERVTLGETSAVKTNCDGLPPPSGDCAMQWMAQSATDSGAYDPSRYTWNTLAWKWGGSAHYISPPLRYSFKLARQVATALAGRSAQDILAEARYWVLLKNLQMLHVAGLANPAQLDALNQAIQQDLVDHPRGRWFDQQFLPTAYQTAMSLPPPIGLAAAAGLAIADFFTRIIHLPRLTYVGSYDAMGRRWPRNQGTYITGDPSTHTQPSQLVDAPSGVDLPSTPPVSSQQVSQLGPDVAQAATQPAPPSSSGATTVAVAGGGLAALAVLAKIAGWIPAPKRR